MLRYLCIIGLIVVSGCHDFQQAVQDAKKDPQPPPKDNYLVLLDLSDRILTNNQQQIPKDISVIQSIYSAFKSKLNAKDPTHLYYTVNDKLKVMVAPQKNEMQDVYDLAGHLRVALASAQPEQKAKMIEETQKKFNTLLPEMYKKAVISHNSIDYAGADIWKYFNEDLPDDIDKDAQNTLFIITDGYMDFEHTAGRLSQEHRYTSCSQIINMLKKQPDWNLKFQKEDYGLLPVGKKFPNLKVILLELNPKDDWSGEYTLMTDIWSKWFKEMDINSFAFVKDENIEEINERIEKLMQVKLISNSQPVSWTPVKDIDTALAAAWAADTTHASFKKKDFTPQGKIADTSNMQEKSVTKKDPPVKHSVKRKDEMSFGPVF